MSSSTPRAASARAGSSSRLLSGGGAPSVPKLALPPSSSRGASSAGGHYQRESHSARPGPPGTSSSSRLPRHPGTARPATSTGAQRSSTGRVLLEARPATAAHAPAGGRPRPQQPGEGSESHAQARPWTSRTNQSTARSIITGKIRRDITAPGERNNRVIVQPDPRWKGLYTQAKKEMKEAAYQTARCLQAAEMDRAYEKAMLGYSGKKVSRARLDFNLFCLEKQGVISPPPPEPGPQLWMSSPTGASSVSSPELEQHEVGRGRRSVH